jgi:hypothetical protein
MTETITTLPSHTGAQLYPPRSPGSPRLSLLAPRRDKPRFSVCLKRISISLNRAIRRNYAMHPLYRPAST